MDPIDFITADNLRGDKAALNVYPPLNSRLDSSLYPPLSCAFLHDLRLTLPNPSAFVNTKGS